MKAAIIERESRPVRAMKREEGLEHIWSSTHENYRGYAGAAGEPSCRAGARCLCSVEAWERC